MRAKRWILLAASPIAALAMAVGWLGAGGFETPEDEPPRPVRSLTLQSAEEVASHRFSGRAEAAERSLLAFRVPGQVEAVLVDLGDRVERGRVLARLDARDYRLKVQELEAGLAAAEARLEQARTNHERGLRLVRGEAISRAQFESMETLWKEAVGARDALREGLATARAALQDTELRAPFEGFVSLRRVEPFEQVAPQRPVLSLDRPDEIEVRVGIPESLVGRRDRLHAVDVHFPVLNAVFPGRVRAVGVDADPATQTYPVRIAIENPEHRILPGMTAEVTFRAPVAGGPDSTSFLVPLTAVFEHEGRPHAWVRDPVSGRVARRSVELGPLTRSGVYLRGQLSEGEVVVTAGVHQLREGQAVRLSDAPLHAGGRP